MSENKKGNLGDFSPIINGQGDVVEIIDKDVSKPTNAGVSKGDVILKAVEAVPSIVESFSSAYQSKQQTLQQKERTKELKIAAEEKIAELQNTTAQMLSENEKQMLMLKSEDSKHERETNIQLQQTIKDGDVKIKELDHEHEVEMRKLDMESKWMETKTSSIEMLQKAIQIKMEKGEDFSEENKMLMEAIQKLDR